ncbi:type II secretion system F family protein [Massilia sp. TS11]|uniref:type II secretion system F family protein n=1 Tax=Massilia sp. TS11 TaxID=2908003 RepID=UPI001EDC6C69|nr:type II secretion system F family protein [Massilia sp. TS11]MCG2583860.1 type II secretion system F family protein [Massilia sp. TS11]
MHFRAKVLTAAQAVELIDIEATSPEEVRRLVSASGGRVLAVHGAGGMLAQGKREAGKGFNLAVFNQQLHSLLEAGQTVVDAIDILGHNDARGRHRHVYDALLQSLREGKQLSEAMLGLPSVFPPLYVAMVRSSETTGTVRTSVQRYMRYQQQVDEIRGKLKTAAIYPAVLLSVGFVVVAFLMLYVVPKFAAVFDDVSATKTVSAGFIQWWGGIVRHHTLLAWLGFFVLTAGLAALFVHPGLRARLLKRVLALPIVGEKLWLLQLARLYRTLGMLLRSGVSVLAAMRMTGAALPEAMRADMTRAQELVAEGVAISTVMRECHLSTEVSQRLLVAGESSGNLDEMMERIADFYDQELATLVDTVGRLVEPALMIIIGLVIGVVVLMLYMPIFDLTSAV